MRVQLAGLAMGWVPNEPGFVHPPNASLEFFLVSRSRPP